jgi:hypothetical protein
MHLNCNKAVTLQDSLVKQQNIHLLMRRLLIMVWQLVKIIPNLSKIMKDV